MSRILVSSISASKIFISGPMRKKLGFNYLSFNEAERYLQRTFDQIDEIYNPITVHKEDYLIDLSKLNGSENLEAFMDSQEFFRKSISWILQEATGIYMLMGWEESVGASIEHSIAKYIGLPISYEYDIKEGERLRGKPNDARG